jgi:hypothetical protein
LDTTTTQTKGIDHEFLSKERERERENSNKAQKKKKEGKKERTEESKVWQNA